MEIKEYFINDNYLLCFLDGWRVLPESFISSIFFILFYFAIFGVIFFAKRYSITKDFKLFKRVSIAGISIYAALVVFIIAPINAEKKHRKEWHEFVSYCINNNNYELLNQALNLRLEHKK